MANEDTTFTVGLAAAGAVVVGLVGLAAWKSRQFDHRQANERAVREAQREADRREPVARTVQVSEEQNRQLSAINKLAYTIDELTDRQLNGVGSDALQRNIEKKRAELERMSNEYDRRWAK